jgi:hypothetical protein
VADVQPLSAEVMAEMNGIDDQGVKPMCISAGRPSTSVSGFAGLSEA